MRDGTHEVGKSFYSRCIEKRIVQNCRRRGLVVRRRMSVTLFLASFAVPALAQIPGGSVSLGYSYLTSGSLSSGPLTTTRNLSNFNGLNVSGELKLSPFISGVAEYGANFGTERVTLTCEVIVPCPGPFHSDTRLHTFLFGPRASFSVGPFRPFAHVLVGGAHLSEKVSISVSGGSFSSPGTAFATAFGGGVDYKLIKGIAWRLQADDLRTSFSNSSQHNLRFTTGIVLRF